MSVSEPGWRMSGFDRHHGPALVLVPGFGGSASADLEFLLPMLARKRRVIAIDFTGLESAVGDVDSPLCIDPFVHRIEQAINAVVPGETVQIMGCSFGAAAAMAVDPELVDALILVAVGLQPTPRARTFASIWRLLSTVDAAGLIQFARFSGFGAGHLPVAGDEDRLPFPVTALSGRQIQLLAETDLTQLALAVRAPTLVIGCTGDDIVPVDQVRQLFAAIATARYVEIDSGHAVVVERPAELLSRIERFLSDPLALPAGSILESVAP